ncbi:hypothetical protein ACJ73_07570 [Blastomyces percursus]|uniref:Uncharacterized protein n=1 Tax=Blastomyces percursus TaxID=1658174 RepID=A0A1J9R0J9_9EURO|nr:hypothetical protein ACJ73_07570 [Blastomyces percursus]
MTHTHTHPTEHTLSNTTRLITSKWHLAVLGAENNLLHFPHTSSYFFHPGLQVAPNLVNIVLDQFSQAIDLLNEQRVLQGELKATQNLNFHDTLVLRDTSNHCRTLQERVAGLQHNCKLFNATLDKMRAQLDEHYHRRVLMERNWTTLHSENQMLWKLISQDSGVSAPGELSPVQQLLNGYRNQQRIIDNLNARIKEHEIETLRSEWSEHEDSEEEETVIIDKDNNEEEYVKMD